MTSWTALNPNALMPSGLVSAVKTLGGLLQGALEDVKSKLSVADALPGLPELPDPNSLVVRTLLDTLSSLLQGGRIHVLPVPISKTFPNPTPPAVPPTLEDLQAVLDVTLGPANTSAADIYADLVQKNGGNAGFFNTFAESLMDLGDPNRPQYEGQHDAVAMVTILVGAPTLASIVSAASTLELLVKPQGSSSSLSARSVPVPEGLKANVVGPSTGKGVGVRLDWDPPEDVFSARYFPGVTMTVKRYAVIKSTDVKLMSAKKVLDLFPTQALTEGMVNGAYKVAAVGSGRNAAYLDTDVDLTKPTYYTVVWECAVTEAGSTTTLPFDQLSGVVKSSPRPPVPGQTGTSPNWVATGAALDVFPPLSQAAQRLIEQTRTVLAPSASPAKNLAETLQLVTSAADRLSARASELISDVERISSALGRPIPSLYITQMSSATGGNAFLLAELSRRLGDTTDPSRPPFDNGEYVCGLCLVAGASRLADLAATLAFFDTMFGAADTTNPLLGILAAVDTLITQAETSVFGQAMTPVGQTVDPITGLPPVPSTPAISDGGAAVASDDPSNPNAGDTNTLDLSKLC